MSPRPAPGHDHDAGGDEALLRDKAALRTEVWAALDHSGVARFPKPTGRIPNFVGAEAAAARLAEPEPFFLLDPARLADAPRAAISIKGASRRAQRVDLDALEPVDLVVTPDEVLRCARPERWVLPRLVWDELTPEKIGAIPLLGRLDPRRRV